MASVFTLLVNPHKVREVSQHPPKQPESLTTTMMGSDRQEYLCQVSETDGGNMFIDLLNYWGSSLCGFKGMIKIF